MGVDGIHTLRLPNQARDYYIKLRYSMLGLLLCHLEERADNNLRAGWAFSTVELIACLASSTFRVY